MGKRKDKKNSFATIKVKGVEVSFDSKEELIDTLVDKFEQIENLKHQYIDLDGEMLRKACVNPEDLMLLDMLTKGNQNALGHLIYKYKKEDIDLEELLDSKDVINLDIPKYELDEEAIKFSKFTDSLDYSTRETLLSLINSWDAESQRLVKLDFSSLNGISKLISDNVHPDIMDIYKEKKLKGSSKVNDFDLYAESFNTLKEEKLSEQEEEMPTVEDVIEDIVEDAVEEEVKEEVKYIVEDTAEIVKGIEEEQEILEEIKEDVIEEATEEVVDKIVEESAKNSTENAELFALIKEMKEEIQSLKEKSVVKAEEVKKEEKPEKVEKEVIKKKEPTSTLPTKVSNTAKETFGNLNAIESMIEYYDKNGGQFNSALYKALDPLYR
jgi:hypothetical protein